MIVHVFNSSIVSGPETLVLPALLHLGVPTCVIFLVEARLGAESRCPVEYARGLGHRVETVTVRSRWDPAAFAELREILDRLRPRIAHAHDVKASLYLHQARKQAPGLRSALVSTHHGAAYRRGKIRLYEEYYVRRVLPHFDLILAVCTQDRASIVRRGVAAAKVAVHLNGTECARIAPKDRNAVAEELRKRWRKRNSRLPASSDAIYFGAVGRLSPEKRHDRMLAVLGALRRSETGSRKPVLVCFGIGAEEERLRNEARRLGVEDAVFWMGYSDTISEEMAGFDALLCLSDGEGIPISLLEAGWAGTPVFATAVGGIPDLISSPDVGYLVDKRHSDEEIASLVGDALSDPAGMQRVGEAFQARVGSEFSRTAWLGTLRAAYTRIEALRAAPPA